MRIAPLAIVTCLVCAMLAIAVHASEGSADSTDTSHSAQQPLDGVWVVQSVHFNQGSKLNETWHSILAIKDGTFTISHFWDSSSDATGAFAIDAARPGTVDLHVDKIKTPDVSFPHCILPAIYKLELDKLTICFHTDQMATRPGDYETKNDDRVVLTLVRVDPQFTKFPGGITVKVTDGGGKPIAGASIFSRMAAVAPTGDVAVNAGHAPRPKLEYDDLATTDKDGTARFTYDAFTHFTTSPINARYPAGKLVGCTIASPAALWKGSYTIPLKPQCVLSGKLECDELTKSGKPLGRTGVALMNDGRPVGWYVSPTNDFQFPISPGTYNLFVYGPNIVSRNVPITLPAGHSELRLPPIYLGASQLAKWQGGPAPELAGVLGWKGQPVKLADLRGKYVLIDFWGYWCSPCVHEMPDLMDLYERYKDKGLVVIGIHVDEQGEAATAAQYDDKIAWVKKNIWHGRDVPFPVALTSGKVAANGNQISGGTAAQYGITAFPTTILIDPQGVLVGNLRDPVPAIEKLFGAKK